MKYKFNIMIVIIILSIFIITPAIATQVYVDGQKLDVSTTSESGTTLVPLRAFFQALGATVDWDNSTQTVTATKEQITVKLKIGSKTAYKNGQPVTLQVPGKVVNGSTMVPLRFVAEAIGCDVTWNEATETISISSSIFTDGDPNHSYDKALNSFSPTSGYIYQMYNRVYYLSWVESNLKLNGLLVIVEVNNGVITSEESLFTGTKNGSDINITFSNPNLASVYMTGTVTDGVLYIKHAIKDGIITVLDFKSGSHDDFNNLVEKVKNSWHDQTLYQIPSSSVAMEPSIPAGSTIIVKRYTNIDALQRHDIVVFMFPMDPSKKFVKRVIGLGGETIYLKDNHLFINGQEVTENYLPDDIYFSDYGPIIIPNGNCFLMGDNRNYSEDSRAWGCLPQNMILGKVIQIIN